MNTKEVKEILDSAKKNNVILMEAAWTRFFQASVQIRNLLSWEYIGEVKMVRADYGVPLLHMSRSDQKDRCEGALLGLGICCLQFICMVYKGEKPESIQASGTCLETGVDETVAVILRYSKNRMAMFTCSAGVELHSDAIIVGTKGTIQVLSPMWCPTSLVVNRKETQQPVPEPSLSLNFTYSTGKRCEVEEVRQCLLKGLKESPVMSHAYTLLLAEMGDEICRQVGGVYSQDYQRNTATKWGICSVGKISHDFTVALKTLPAEDHQVVAVAARKLEDAQEFARKHNISKAYGSYEELARDPDVDVVYVGVIHPCHLNACKLFINAKKNVLCEKPLAMNAKEVKEILDSAKKNDVFLMEAAWTRFFPASVEIRKLLAEEYIGEVKMVRADFGVPLFHVPRSDQKDLGGGALLGLGISCLQFISMVYNREKPESIQASGICLETGVDETVAVILKYSKNRMATFTCSAGVELHSEAIIIGTEGKIQVLSPMWCPTSIIVDRKETEYPIPERCLSLNFTYSTGKRYEVEEVRQCLLKGLKESPVTPHAYTLLLAEMGDEVRRQVEVVYSQDCQRNMATRWGICSAGKISHDFTVALKTLPAEDHQVVAVAARKLEDAQEFARKHNISKAYGSYDELARDPDVDVVYVGVVHPCHLNACKLFTNAKKNVLCEKPLAMNAKEVKEILDSAKKNNVFLMEAAWTRFFPASVQIRNLLAQEYIGDVKMVRADYGVPRSDQKDLGGGALLDLGIFCLQFISMVYNGEKPESIQASGICLETGVNKTLAVILKYSKNRMAMFTCFTGVQLHNDAIIVGTKGKIQVPSPMWCPTSLVVNKKETQYPVPEPSLPLNFTNSTGKRYEAEEVRQCLLKGLKESPVMPHADSLLLAEMGDEIRRQVGVVYSQDCQRNMATRWGICSAGKISHDFTVALKTLPAEDHQVVAVAARKLENAQEFANKHSISRVYGSYEELARDPDIDVVYVGVIHPYHLSACKLFINAKKNVLCEKPLAMNAKEVKEILDSAKKNNVFLMEAVWTRFFPASVQIRNLLAQGEIGEVKMVRADFCVPLLHVPRSVQKDLGGGALLDLGIYCLQFISMVYNGEKPESIQASGICLETGVDESVAVILKYSKNRMATFTCSAGVQLPNDAIIAGTKSKIQVPSPMWCPTSLVVNEKVTQYPVPEPSLPLNFTNSTGMCYEAEEVRQCLLKGLKESPVMPHADSLLLAEMEDEIRQQVGVVYSQDCQSNMATRWGICSTGKISHDFTVALKTLPAEDHQAVAVAARKLEDAQEFSRKHNISKAYGSYEELARDPDVDVVYIGNIHPHHLKACLLFMNAKKNVLCEKPLAMNTKEVKEILDSAKRNQVFLMEAVWTRFFPVSEEVRKLLAQREIGEVKMIRSEFGIPLLHRPRLVEKELGGGALLSLGMYCLQFVCMVYNGERPESIQATGVCLDTGVDETVIVTLKFSEKRMAVFTYSSSMKLPNDAIIVGTKGTIQIPSWMWCPTSLIVNGKETQYPLPEPCLPLNFHNGTGMRYEAEEVRQCLLKGLKESPVMSHSDSLLLIELEDEIRRQVGVVYSQDCL
ncbi:PREDICTED: uncharacterized protein LOC106922158 isoform X1 [Poecilia mexicana]|uniref:uncharacterized protein LOC106922158 isoform X1 n=1 Tax=Poecilia mexicana TaxID=48701 RepID=UPI00072DCE8A|nr:PREDICTED: uncharacterized protein LOC106922158 isoform X1 [Poecilia mexicana]